MLFRSIAVPIPHQDKARHPNAIADAARRVGLAAEARESVEDALARIVRLNLDPPPRILITGSLYLAGAALAANGTVPQ